MEEKNRTYTHSIANVWMCNAKYFFIILACRQHTQTNEFHIFLKFEIENVGQGHGVQFSELQHSMANVNIYKT